ncbi:hypothetical protein [Geomicrobium sp. JCM 19037]|uniref:hypothetical protein n=1 Tax=Geomicrobium sp. JCM 19037 TaxID=1460634 RepID=UPI0005A6DD11|nr:hypothetical protein [Geomicrobium sp. JCM 19037]
MSVLEPNISLVQSGTGLMASLADSGASHVGVYSVETEQIQVTNKIREIYQEALDLTNPADLAAKTLQDMVGGNSSIRTNNNRR